MRIRKTLTFFMLVLGLIYALSAWAQQKPLTQDQVLSLVRSGLGDETGAKAIEQRGIDFAPSEDLYQTLKGAGASEPFLNALRAAKPPEPASAKKPINQVQVFALLAGGVPGQRVTMLVQERGIDFEPTDEYLQEVRLAGGEDELISALKIAKVTKPEHVDPALQARQTEVRQHVAQGLEFLRNERYADGESEYRAAINLDPENPELRRGLALALEFQNDLGGAIAEYREALRLDPKDGETQYLLGRALERKGDMDAAIAVYREALRLKPDPDEAVVFDSRIMRGELVVALLTKKDIDGAIEVERETVRLNPNDDKAHESLGETLEHKGDEAGAIAEYREALRLNPNNWSAHYSLGEALEHNGDLDGAIAEYRHLLSLDPHTWDKLASALRKKGDLDGSIAVCRGELRVRADDYAAHFLLGMALREKGDLDDAIAEFRTTLRYASGKQRVHYELARTLEDKGDRQDALEEYRAAHELDPQNPDYRQAYERLLQQLGR